MPLVQNANGDFEMVDEATFQQMYGVTSASIRALTEAGEPTPESLEYTTLAGQRVEVLRTPPPVGQNFPPWLIPLLGAIATGIGGGVVKQLTGGEEFTMNGVEFGGPGLAEPSSKYVEHEWSTNGAQFYKLRDGPPGYGKIAVYSKKRKKWKLYKPARHIVISKNPRVGTLIKGAKRIDNLMLSFDKRLRKFRSRTRVAGHGHKVTSYRRK